MEEYFKLLGLEPTTDTNKIRQAYYDKQKNIAANKSISFFDLYNAYEKALAYAEKMNKPTPAEHLMPAEKPVEAAAEPAAPASQPEPPAETPAEAAAEPDPHLAPVYSDGTLLVSASDPNPPEPELITSEPKEVPYPFKAVTGEAPEQEPELTAKFLPHDSELTNNPDHDLDKSTTGRSVVFSIFVFIVGAVIYFAWATSKPTTPKPTTPKPTYTYVYSSSNASTINFNTTYTKEELETRYQAIHTPNYEQYRDEDKKVIDDYRSQIQEMLDNYSEENSSNISTKLMILEAYSKIFERPFSE